MIYTYLASVTMAMPDDDEVPEPVVVLNLATAQSAAKRPEETKLCAPPMTGILAPTSRVLT
jgi:hypothetical protein